MISCVTFSRMRLSNFSRSLLISSIDSVAITNRSWPRMMSCASSRMPCGGLPSRFSAAEAISTGPGEIRTVNVAGTFTRMLFSDSAPSKGMSITSGSRLM
ncbi:MAG: hypothetical protein KatS3mg103_1079 [Phycisphaerales bacterium]|nr:MAG: hypothetical protein KatS3mg103_1079 [Phycisphaerales bacterium]